MEVAGIVLNQVAVMFLLIAIGFILVKRQIITVGATRVFCNLLLMIVVPCTIIKAYYQPFSADKAWKLMIAFALSAFFHFLAIGVSRLLYKKNPSGTYRIERLSVVYSNCGFMGFPILAALLGEDGVFYGTAFFVMFNIFIWIEGVQTLKDGEKIGWKKAVLNPGCIAVVLGVLTYFSQVPLPRPVEETISYLGGMNTPLAMLITGVFMAEVSAKETMRDIRGMGVGLVKTLLLPVLFLLCMMLLQRTGLVPGSTDVYISMVMCAACPTAASVILIPASFHMDGSEGAKLLAISTLMSLVTMPLLSYVAYLAF